MSILKIYENERINMDNLEIQISAGLNKQQSVQNINKDITKIEKQLKQLKLKLSVSKDSRNEIQKQIANLNKEKRQLYVDLKLRKDALKSEYKALQSQNKMSLNIDTANAQKQIKNVSSVMGDTKNETVGLGLALKNAFTNAGLVISAQNALQMIRKAANEATQAVKEYDQYITNLSVITGGSRESSNQLLGDLAEKSLDFKVDISSLESAAETLLRTGKSIDETNKYLENTVYLSKLGFQDMDTSASQLVTIGNAYGYTADEMSAVVDKFVKLDTSANITAGKLSEAVSKSAQNAKLAGFNIDQLSASIAGLKDSSGRSESEISNSLNMIFSRLQNVKLGKFVLETEDGTEDVTQQINDMEKLLDTFGIKLRNSKNEFRDLNELFTELSDNWNKFNSVQQSAIATTAAGARQRNTFIGLIENWNKIQELTDVSLNSMGTAVQKYDNYLQSIESKSAVLNTSMKELWNNLLPTEFIGNMTDAGTAVVQFTDKYQILQTALKSATFYALAKGAIAAKNSFAGMVTDVKNLSAAFSLALKGSALTNAEFASLKTIASGLSDKQLKLLLSTNNLSTAQKMQLVNTEGLTQAEIQAKYATLGISEANQTATASTFSLSGSMKALFATLSANPVLLLTAGFTAFTAIQQTVQRQNEKMRESAIEAIDKYNEQAQALDDLRQKYIDICDSEDSTSKKTEELNEWKKTLIETYGLEKEAIEQVNLARENSLKLIDDEIIKNQINGAETWLTDNRKAYEDAQKKLLGANNSAETSVIPKANIVMNIEKGALDDYSENFDDIIKQLTIKNPTKDNPLAQIKIQGSNVLQQYENLSKILNDITSIEVTKGLNKSEQELYDALLAKQAEYKKVVSDDMRDIVENGKKYTSMIQLYNFETDSGINFDNVSDDTYKEFRDKFLESLGYGYKKDSEFSLDIEKILLDMLPDLENSYRGIEITDIVDTSNADEIKEDINSVANAVEEFSETIKNASKKQSALKSAMEDMSEKGYISASTYATLVELGGNFAECLEVQNGKLVLNVEKLKELEAAEYATAISMKKLEIESWKAANAASLHGDFSNQEWLEKAEAEIAVLEQLRDELNNTKPDEKKSSKSTSTKDDKPQSIIDFETELARRQHEIKMGRMEEDEAYFDWLEKAYREAYKGLTGYQDDIYKYEEMVYDGRQKLAEDFYNEQKKKHENRVEELETQITVAENKSVNNNGNSLNPAEKFDYIRASYSDLIAENERRINEIMQSGIEGHEDEVKELERQIEEYADKLQDVFKDEIDYEINYIETLQDKYNDFIDKRIDRYEDEKKALEDKYDAEIKSIDDTIDALKDKNDETKTAIDLKKAEQDLENAKQRTRMVYGADGSIGYSPDTDKIQEAQQKVDDLKLEMLLDSLEKQKEAKEAEKDAALQTYETMIDDLEQQKKDRDEFFKTVIEKLDNINNPQPTEGINRVVDKTYDDPNEANEVKQGLKDVENAVKDGTEQAKDNANEVKKADNNTTSSANKTDNKSQSANSKTATTANSNNNNAVKTDVKQSGNSVNKNTSETADNKTGVSNKQVVVYGEQVAVYDNGGENKQTEQTSNYDSFMKLLYSMSGKEPDGYERWKRGEYDEGNKLMSNIFSDDAFMNRAKKPYEDAINSFNETVNKLNDIKLNQQPVNVTTGDIVIQNPVGNTKQLAQEIKSELYKEAMMQIPNDAMRIIYKK